MFMTVFNLAFTVIKGSNKMQEYIESTAPLIRQYGVEVVVRGRYLKSLLRDQKKPHITGIFRFPDMVTAESFYNCPEYVALIPLRERAGELTLNFYKE